MTLEENRLSQRRRERVARVKRILRWMPRRATIHRYPVLKWSAKTARKRSYLWSFRAHAAVPALYAGCILALLPLYGLQLPLSLLVAFLFRANLPILASLQFLTNPFTLLPAYFTGYQVGKAVLNLFGVESPSLNMEGLKAFFSTLSSGAWSQNFDYLLTVWLVMALGGVILGTFLATIASVIYKIAAYEVAWSYKRLMELQSKRESENQPAATGKTSQEAPHG